jgi:hypothetical protein
LTEASLAVPVSPLTQTLPGVYSYNWKAPLKKEQCLTAPREVPERLLKGEYAFLLAPAGASGGAAAGGAAAGGAAGGGGGRSGKKREAEEGEQQQQQGDQGQEVEPSPMKKVRW